MTAHAARPSIVYVVTTDTSADIFLRGQLAHLAQNGFDVAVVCGHGERAAAVAQREGVPCHTISLEREFSGLKDIRALLELVRLLRRLRPDVVNASTSKGGLIGLCAAWAARVPHRVYLLRGLRLETLSPTGQAAMSIVERLCSTLAERVVCVSPSLRDAYLARRLAPPEKCIVLGSGSSNGVDFARFAPSEALERRADEIAAELGLHRGHPTIGCVGRPVADKGIRELQAAFGQIRARMPLAQLLIVGAGFAGDAECVEMANLRRTPGVFVVPSVADVAPYYRLMSLLAFPSYREGFPNVVLEASASGIPVVGFAATGVRDAIVDGVTGRVCPMRDSDSLAAAMLEYLSDPALAARHGEAGAERARSEFSRARVWASVLQFYREMLGSSEPEVGGA